jgi:hypothetical protein
VYQQQQQEQQQQDAENPFLDPPFSQIKNDQHFWDLEGQALEDEDKLMLRRGTLRPHGDDEEGQDSPTEEKPVFNRGKRREHDDEWEEPLLKRIKHLKEMTMKAEAARAGKRLKHAVTALSVMSYESG